MARIGTYDIQSLQESRFPVKEYDFEQITQVLNDNLAAWNARMNQALGILAETNTEVEGITGSDATVRGQRTGEYGSGHSQIETPGAKVAFPLYKYSYDTGWTAMWMANALMSDVVTKHNSVLIGNLADTQMDFKIAMFTSGNRTVYDRLVDNQALGIKAFLNADGAPIPPSPQDGQVFDPATHNHYLAKTALAAADVNSLIDTVMEHVINAATVIVINKADATQWEALDGFTPAQRGDIGVFRNTALPDVPDMALDTTQTSDRFLGYFGAANVWAKPWGISGYAFCMDVNAQKPLNRRVHPGLSQGIELVQELSMRPLTTDFYEHVFGFGVKTRTNGAVLQYDAGVVDVYEDPVIIG